MQKLLDFFEGRVRVQRKSQTSAIPSPGGQPPALVCTSVRTEEAPRSMSARMREPSQLP